MEIVLAPPFTALESVHPFWAPPPTLPSARRICTGNNRARSPARSPGQCCAISVAPMSLSAIPSGEHCSVSGTSTVHKKVRSALAMDFVRSSAWANRSISVNPDALNRL